jgi:phage terminase large subunit-like protein
MSYLQEKMTERREFSQIVPVEDKRRKPVRIAAHVGDLAANGRLFVHPSQTQLITQFAAYPQCAHDDFLDALSIAISVVNPYLDAETLEGEFEVVDPNTGHYLENWRA